MTIGDEIEISYYPINKAPHKLRTLLKIARKALSLRKDAPFRLVAIGITKGKEVLLGYPTEKTHPFVAKVMSKRFMQKEMFWLHAEQDLCFKAKALHYDLSYILVARERDYSHG